MAATKNGAGATVPSALEALERCCKPPSGDVTSTAVEAAAECKASAERMQKKAEELEKGAAASEALAAKLKAARDKYAIVYRQVQNARDDIQRDLDDLEPKLCARVGKEMAKALAAALAEKTKCKNDACAAVDTLTGKPKDCYEAEHCDCSEMSKAEIEGAKAEAEAKVAELTGYLEKLLKRDEEVTALLATVQAGIAALKTAATNAGAERAEYVQFLQLKAFFWEKLSEGKLNTVARYESRLADLFKKIRHFNCHVLPDISDCLTQRTQDIDRATKCCKDHTDNLVDEVVDAVEDDAEDDCKEEEPPPCEPPEEPEEPEKPEEPCEDDDENQESGHSDDDDPTGW